MSFIFYNFLESRAKILKQLRKNSKVKNKHFKVYGSAKEFPKHYHATFPNPNSIIIVFNAGWSVKKSCTHGFNPRNPYMYGIFSAFGDYFIKNKRLPLLESSELYNLFCHILGLKYNRKQNNCYANDGHNTNLRRMVMNPNLPKK